MKICLIEDFFPPAISGGASVYVGRIAGQLADAGHRVSVITTKPWNGWRSLFFSQEKRNNIIVYSIYPWLLNIPIFTSRVITLAKPWTLLMYIFNPFVYGQYVRLLKKIQPDVAHTHDTIYLSLAIFPALRAAHVPNVHTGHFVHFIAPLGLPPNRPSAPSWWQPVIPLVRKIVGSPRVVITISKFYLKMHHSYGFFLSARTELLTTAMDAPDEPQNGLEQRSQRVLYAGRLDPEKGLPDLIQAFQGLPQPEAELLICGAGQSEDALKKLASADPRIKFLGRKTYAELKELYRTCRVVGLPSYAQEIFPLSIVEANAHGTPAIATNTGGSPEMVEDGKTGWLFSPGDVASLRGHLEALLTNDNQWQVFHTAGLKKYRSLQPERHLDRLAEIYQMAKMGS